MAPASSNSTFQDLRSSAARSRAFGDRSALPRQRQHRGLDRSQPRIEPQHRALVHAALGVGRLVLGVGVDEKRHQRPGQTGRGLDHVRHVAGLGGLVVERQVDAGML